MKNNFLNIFFYSKRKKNYSHQERPKRHFWQLLFFMCVFKNTDQKNICASIILKLNPGLGIRSWFLDQINSFLWSKDQFDCEKDRINPIDLFQRSICSQSIFFKYWRDRFVYGQSFSKIDKSDSITGGFF